MQNDPFDGLVQAIREPNLGVYCPGADCSLSDSEAAAGLAEQILDVLSGPAYDIGTLPPAASISEAELVHMIEAGRYRLPHAVCAVHFNCTFGEDMLDEVMVLRQLGEKIGVTMFTSVDDEWNLIPVMLMIDPEDLPFEGDQGRADCFELDGFDVAVMDPESLDEAMSIQTELLHRVIEAITPNKPRLH